MSERTENNSGEVICSTAQEKSKAKQVNSMKGNLQAQKEQKSKQIAEQKLLEIHREE